MKNNKAEETVAEFFQYQEDCFVMPDEKQIKAFKTVPEKSKIENRRVRKIRCIPIIAACLAIVVSIVSVIAVLELSENDIVTSDLTNSNDSTTDLDGSKDNSLSAEPKEHVIYCYAGAGVAFIDKSGSSVKFEEAERKVFSFSSKSEISKPSDADDQRTLALNGKEYSLHYSKSYETALSSSNDFQNYSKFNSYKDGTITAETRVSTNELLFFSNVDENVRNTIGDITENEAKNIASETILSLYGEIVQREYAYETTIFTDTDSTVQYTVVYRKYVWGTPTNDAIQISINMKGDIVSINAKHLGMFSLAENQIQKTAITDAISTLEATFSEYWNIFDTRLVLDAEGDYYIYAQLSRKNVEAIEAIEVMEVYINII